MNIRDLIEQKINKTWKEFDNTKFTKFSPLAIEKISDKGIFFVGLNPSLSDEQKDLLRQEKTDKKCQFYTLDKNKDNAYKYFYKFYEIAEQINLEWGHFDLFYYRETNQKNIEKLLKTQQGTDFFYKQAMVTKNIFDKLIDPSNPKIFVVTNTLTRDLLGTYRKVNETKNKKDWWLNFDFIWNNDWGTYEYKGQPFFFSSMLTGQRALDKGSLERLIWHINEVKNKLIK